MNFDDCQSLWQKQPLPTTPRANSAALAATIRRVRADARAFDRTIFWRDLRECVAALLVFLFFAHEARAKTLAGASSWTLWLAAALPLGVAGFLLIDRVRAHRRPKEATTVLASLDHALAELRHQHRLLMNVIWWYLLPIALATALYMADSFIVSTTSWPGRIIGGGICAAMIAAVNYPIWRLNRRAATLYLAPRIVRLEIERRDFADEFDPPPSNSASNNKSPVP